MRINRYFTDQGFCSRREADRLIEAGRVAINGRKAVLGDQITETDMITLDGQPVKQAHKRVYIMYHKPVGITSTTDQSIRGNIIDAIKHPLRIFPIGRLDKDSTGLILLTNDGDIVNRILRAENAHEKEYEVKVDKPVTEAFLLAMSKGVDIGDHTTLPAKVSKKDTSLFSIVLVEGKNRQIRRMCEALGFNVVTLHRVRIMNIKISNLKAGQWRDLTEEEFSVLKSSL